MDFKERLIEGIEAQSITVGIVGLGYVGLPLLLRFSSEGFNVVGFDIDQEKIDLLTRRETYLKHIPNDRLEAELTSTALFTTRFELVSQVDAVIICVPTPLGKHNEPDLSFVTGTIGSMASFLRSGQLISLESTTYPGTTEEEIVSRIESQGLKVGDEVFVVYSPEREDPGNKNFTTATIPKVVGGHTNACLKVGTTLYSSVIDEVVPVSSTKVAEMTKLLENIHRAVNIGLVNELKIAADEMGINIHEVIKAAATKPFGFTPYFPGPGLGGHCIPIDPFYLTWKAKEYGVHTRFIELAGEVNSSMPGYVVNKISQALNSKSKAIAGSHILLVGMAYKPDINDMRESPGLDIFKKLENLGGQISYHDPFVPKLVRSREFRGGIESAPLSRELLVAQDVVVIVTNHSVIDYELLHDASRLVVDTRGVYQGSEKVFVA